MHSSDTGLIFFEDVRVPIKNTVGEEGQGFIYQMLQFQVRTYYVYHLIITQLNFRSIQLILTIFQEERLAAAAGGMYLVCANYQFSNEAPKLYDILTSQVLHPYKLSLMKPLSTQEQEWLLGSLCQTINVSTKYKLSLPSKNHINSPNSFQFLNRHTFSASRITNGA